MSAEPLPAVEQPPRLGPDGRKTKEWTTSAWQRAAHALSLLKRFLVIPAGRRCGKSEFGVQWVLLRYLFARQAGLTGVIWIIYPTYDIARVAWRKFRRLTPKGWIVQWHGTELHPQALIMAGGITIEFKSGVNPGALVGEGLLAVWIDECGEVKERVWVESIRPALMDHVAPALFTGTPKGRNWFWRLYCKGWNQPEGNTGSIGDSITTGTASALNPFVSEDEIASLAEDMTKRLYLQEILAKFLSSEGAVFNIDRIRDKGLAYSTEPTVSIGVDLARRSDFTVLIGMDRDFKVTHFERFNDIDWPLQRMRIEATWLKLDKPALVIESNGVGDPVVQELQYSGVYVTEAFQTTSISKRQLVERLAIACDQAVMTLPDEPLLLNELEAFELQQMPSGNVRYQAPENQHDDCVISLGLALRGAERYGDLGISVGGLK